MAIKIKNSTIIDDSRNLVDVGISTVTSLSIGSTEVISSSRQLKNIVSLDATTTATIESAIANAPNTFTDLNVTGITTTTSLNIGADVGISTTRTTVATTAATTIDSFAIATFRSARVQVQITQSTNYQTSDVLIIHNGTTADVVEYGAIATNDYLGTFSAIVSGGNCLLQINMSSATSSTVKVLSQRITV
jgi:hypothetical protein